LFFSFKPTDILAEGIFMAENHAENDELLRNKISQFIDKREYPKTCCPSDVARALTTEELRSLDCEDWRAAMQIVREMAWTMREGGLLEITQKGEAVQATSLETIKGPIRLRATHTNSNSTNVCLTHSIGNTVVLVTT
jgi:hypothetical protein